MLLVHHLHLLQTPQILVKVANAEQAEIVKLVGASDVIQPEQSTARKAALLIHHPRAVDYLELGGGHLVVAAHPPTSSVGKKVSALAWQERYGVALLALWQDGQEGPPSPAGSRSHDHRDRRLDRGGTHRPAPRTETTEVIVHGEVQNH